ncbi:MAG: ABC transporter ATP-binding protein [Proteobacteria bacterium]|nr:ABC transporter ATP-binding protein [Pseudomonadota bacterium]MBU2226316.1 ABC transporter ATP-binding protein [Pseudomonadota bacterium]MBU2260550.1 ABC transporter ATP-binding protein [Pseudomonadota bacterium]
MSLLKVKNLTKRFGGLVAVNDLSFEVSPGEIVGLIGPNGAGKTTVFNLLSGIHSCDAGSVTLGDREITHLAPHRRSLAGIGRTFQVVRPFEMTVLENVMVPALARNKSVAKARETAFAVLKMMGIENLADALPGNLTLAQRKRIEVARAMATKPRLLLLDEVLAGLNPTEVAENLPLIRQLRDQGATIIFIEHVMAAVMKVSERVLVMAQGALICCGTPSEVTNDECVIKAYLGEEDPECSL